MAAHAACLLPSVAAMLLLSSCDAETHIDCDHRPAAVVGVLPKVGHPGAAQARAIIHDYLNAAVSTGSLPTETGFRALGFSSRDLGQHYRPGALQAGFGKQPSAQRVRFRNGPELLFCFNQWVIRCAPGRRCQCPYDDNPPELPQ